jgi:hypothetical protein
MLFEIKNCTVAEILDTVTGTSQAGNNWSRTTIVFEHKEGDYTDKYPMTVFGEDKLGEVNALKDRRVNVKFDLRSREYNGRWYTDIRLVYISAAEAEAPKPVERPVATQPQEDNEPDLPF